MHTGWAEDMDSTKVFQFIRQEIEPRAKNSNLAQHCIVCNLECFMNYDSLKRSTEIV